MGHQADIDGGSIDNYCKHRRGAKSALEVLTITYVLYDEWPNPNPGQLVGRITTRINPLKSLNKEGNG